MQLVRFRHKGLRQLYEDDIAKGVPPAMADKLRKLFFALETADDIEKVRRFPGWNLEPASSQGRSERLLEPDRHWKLAFDFSLRSGDEHRE